MNEPNFQNEVTASALRALGDLGDPSIDFLRQTWGEPKSQQHSSSAGETGEPKEPHLVVARPLLNLRPPRRHTKKTAASTAPLSAADADVNRELAKLRQLKASLKLSPDLTGDEVASLVAAAAQSGDTKKAAPSAKGCAKTSGFGGTVPRFGSVNGHVQFSRGNPAIASSPPRTAALAASSVHLKLYEDARARRTVHQNASVANKPPSVPQDHPSGAHVSNRLYADAVNRQRRHYRDVDDLAQVSKQPIDPRSGAPGISFSRAGRSAPVAFFLAPGDLVDHSQRVTTARRFEGPGAVVLPGPSQKAPFWVDKSIEDPQSKKGSRRRTRIWLAVTVASAAAVKLKSALEHRRAMKEAESAHLDDKSAKLFKRREWWVLGSPLLGNRTESFNAGSDAHSFYTATLRNNVESEQQPPKSSSALPSVLERLWQDAEDRSRRLAASVLMDSQAVAPPLTQSWQTLVFPAVPAAITKEVFVAALESILGRTQHHTGTGGIVSVFDHIKVYENDAEMGEDENAILATAAFAESAASDELEFLALVYHGKKRFEDAESMLKSVLATRKAAFDVASSIVHDLIDSGDMKATKFSVQLQQLSQAIAKTMINLATSKRAIGGRFRYRDAGALERRAAEIRKELLLASTKQTGTSDVQSRTDNSVVRRITIRCAGATAACKLLSMHRRYTWARLIGHLSTDFSCDEGGTVAVTICPRQLKVGCKVELFTPKVSGTVISVVEVDKATNLQLPFFDMQAAPISGFSRTVLIRRPSYTILLDNGKRLNHVSPGNIVRGWLPVHSFVLPRAVSDIASNQNPVDAMQLAKIKSIKKTLSLVSHLIVHGLSNKWTKTSVRTLVDCAINRASQGKCASSGGCVLKVGVRDAVSVATSKRASVDPQVRVDFTVTVLGRHEAASVLVTLDGATVPSCPDHAEVASESPGESQGEGGDYDDDFDEEDAEEVECVGSVKKGENGSPPCALAVTMLPSGAFMSAVTSIRLEWIPMKNALLNFEECETTLWWYLDYLVGKSFDEGASAVVDCRLQRKQRRGVSGVLSHRAIIDVTSAESAQKILVCVNRTRDKELSPSSTLSPLTEQFRSLKGVLAVSNIEGREFSLFSKALARPPVHHCHLTGAAPQRRAWNEAKGARLASSMPLPPQSNPQTLPLPPPVGQLSIAIDALEISGEAEEPSETSYSSPPPSYGSAPMEGIECGSPASKIHGPILQDDAEPQFPLAPPPTMDFGAAVSFEVGRETIHDRLYKLGTKSSSRKEKRGESKASNSGVEPKTPSKCVPQDLISKTDEDFVENTSILVDEHADSNRVSTTEGSACVAVTSESPHHRTLLLETQMPSENPEKGNETFGSMAECFYKASGGADGSWICEDGWQEVFSSESVNAAELIKPFGVTFASTEGSMMLGGDWLSSFKLPGNGLSGDALALVGPLRGLFTAPHSSRGLIELNLSFNLLSGNLADLLPWSELTCLRTLALAGNALRGPLPPDLGLHLKSIEEIYLGANALGGELPATLCQLPDLRVLSLSQNLFTGSLQSIFGNCGTAAPVSSVLRLERLDLAHNGFEDESWRQTLRAARLGHLPALCSLDFRNNPFCEASPEEICSLLKQNIRKAVVEV